MGKKRTREVALFVVAGALAALLLGADTKTVHRDFDTDATGSPPAFFRFEGTPGLAAERWKTIPDAQAFSKPNVGVQTVTGGEAGHFHFALATQTGNFADGTVQGLTKRAATKGFARGGVVARYVDPAHFVAALVDFQTQTVTLVSVRDGKAVALGAGAVVSDEPVWRTVRLEASGKTLRVSVSGHVAIEAQDPAPRSGAAGFVAEAPVPVAFDDLDIEAR